MSQHDYARRLSGGDKQPYESTPKGEPANEMPRILARLDVMREYVLKLCDRSERIVTRAFGDVSHEVTKDQPRAVPQGTIGALDERIGDILSELDRLDTTITRLDGLV